MRKARSVLVMVVCGFVFAAGCGSSGDDDSGSGTGKNTTGGSGGGAAAGGVGGSATGGADTGGTGGLSTGGSGGIAGGGTGGSDSGIGGGAGTGGGAAGTPGAQCSSDTECASQRCINGYCCIFATCKGQTYACGDCEDNDQDGLTDMEDPDCLGPCHNAEDKYTGCIPGQNQAGCKADCYFDYDSGSGNDDCYWDHRCDPLSVAPDYPPEGPACAYDPDFVIPSPSLTCAEAKATQSSTCLDVCEPLVPNGCDCFGCCELPAESGRWVYVGSTSDDSGRCVNGTCTLEAANALDESACKPCTPVDACLDTCEHCELCLGKTELPDDCPGPTPDAGTGGSGGSPCGGQICPAGSQPCGLSCQPPCADGYYCNTGCCVANPR